MSDRMKKLEQEHREWVRMTRQIGFREGIIDLLAHQYPEKTHFIFELLQNADDAKASEVKFYLEEERLIFSHNGKDLFSDEHVEKIVDIGRSSKREDYTKIGKHGIGFKAVFAYTHMPRIHSGDKHFDIVDVFVPQFLCKEDIPTDLAPLETRIILPFDSEEISEDRRFRDLVPADKAKTDISSAIKKLSLRTLLFLRHINKICWVFPDETKGELLRDTSPVEGKQFVRYVVVKDRGHTESWLIFERETEVSDDSKIHSFKVEVAFLMKDKKVIPAQNTELVVFLPTEKKTELGFLIQGPFKTTKARDNIDHDSNANKHLIKIAAQLAADSLETLQDRDLLDVSSYTALPLRVQDFPIDSFFRPVYEKIREALREKPLLPTYGGGFVKAADAKLARGEKLVELFTPEHLGKLFDRQKISWLNPAITESGPFDAFHAYIIGKKQKLSREWEIEPLAEGLQIDIEDLVPSLKQGFLAAQDISWIIELINYVKDSRSSRVKSVPIIRLENGQHVSLPNETGQSSAFFAPKDYSGLDLSAFPVVASSLAGQKEVRAFLEKEGVREIDDVAIVEKCILPKYKNANLPSVDEHLRDIGKIVLAYKTDSIGKNWKLKQILNDTSFILTEIPAIKATRYQKPSSVYFRTEELLAYFSGCDTIGFVSSDYSQSALELFKELGVRSEIIIECRSRYGSDDFIPLNYKDGYHRRGLKGFDPNISVDGLEYAIKNPTPQRSNVVWNKIAMQYSHCIKGKILLSSRQDFSPNASIYKEEETISDFGKLLTQNNNKWLPSNTGEGFFEPSELTLSDLPEGFEKDSIRAKDLAEKLGMRKPVDQTAIESLAKGDLLKQRAIELVLNSDADTLHNIIKLQLRESVPKQGQPYSDALNNINRPPYQGDVVDVPEDFPIKNPATYQEALNDRVEDGVNKHLSTPTIINHKIIQESPSNEDAKAFLYGEYSGYCQITGETFTKSDGKNYFVAVPLLERADAIYLNDPGNMLCLCAEMAARFMYGGREWIDKPEQKITEFKAERDGGNESHRKIRIKLCGEEQVITYSEGHFMRLKALFEKA